jgi:hypothetical protein
LVLCLGLILAQFRHWHLILCGKNPPVESTNMKLGRIISFADSACSVSVFEIIDFPNPG